MESSQYCKRRWSKEEHGSQRDGICKGPEARSTSMYMRYKEDQCDYVVLNKGVHKTKLEGREEQDFRGHHAFLSSM